MPAQSIGLARLALDWLDSEARPRLILSLSLEILWSNAAGRDAIGTGPWIKVREGRLSFESRGEEQRFRTYLESLNEAVATFALPFSDGTGHFLFRGVRLGEDGHYCLEVVIDRPGSRPRLPDLDSVFGLTKSEAKTVAEMFSGKSVAEIARAQGLSIDTIRSHVRAAYNKIGANSKEQLFSRLLHFRII